MKIYQSKYAKLNGSSYLDIERKARKIYLTEVKRTKRNPYVRSKYFNGDKVFLKLFWDHLHQKHRSDRERRLIYYQCALDTIRHNAISPEIKRNPNNPKEVVFRFQAKTKSDDSFYVQVKQDKKGSKHFMSVFPWKQKSDFAG